MKSNSITSNPEIRVPVAAVMTWFLPGAGHLFIGERVRGIVFMTAIALTYWGGVAIGGVANTINLDQRPLWFAGQICAGAHTLAALTWSKKLDSSPGQDLRAYGRAEEVSVVYTAICGMLNVLIIFDVLVRAEKAPVVVPERGPPRRERRAVR